MSTVSVKPEAETTPVESKVPKKAKVRAGKSKSRKTPIVAVLRYRNKRGYLHQVMVTIPSVDECMKIYNETESNDGESNATESNAAGDINIDLTTPGLGACVHPIGDIHNPHLDGLRAGHPAFDPIISVIGNNPDSHSKDICAEAILGNRAESFKTHAKLVHTAERARELLGNESVELFEYGNQLYKLAGKNYQAKLRSVMDSPESCVIVDVTDEQLYTSVVGTLGMTE